MQIIEPAIFGAVQGLAEFLPISSSGHLLLLHSVTHFSVGSDLTFDVALHVGTLVALIAYFWRDFLRILGAWLGSFRRWDVRTDVNQRLAWLLVLASIPGALAGAVLESKAETIFRAPALTAVVLIGVGILLWAADRFVGQRDGIENVGWKQALAIGVAQAVAIVPGVSRSGATIAVGRALKMTREAAARFSFYMSAPIIAGAVLKKAFELRNVTFSSQQQWDFLIGAAVAAIVGYLAIRILLRFISRHSYSIFMWYRVLLGVIVLLVVWIAK
jgi:undecaprenyl-diphosphatase